MSERSQTPQGWDGPSGATRLAVIGLGYVGLPLAVTASQAGLAVRGLDLSRGLVASLAAGRSHVGDVSDDELTGALAQGFRPTTDPADLDGADVVVICVPTPLGASGVPDLTAVESAAAAVAASLAPGMLVVLESTTYPGTTEDLLLPILEGSGLKGGTDFALAFSPERIDPGNPHYHLANTPKVVGGYTPACTERAAAFYRQFISRVVTTRGTREAEMAKLLENTYRHVNIALVNEMAVFCDDLGIDLWDAIEAASTKPFGFQAFSPGPGVGGHCIPIDPNYLSYRVRQLGYPFRFVELAQEINARMPAYVVSRAQRLLNDHAKAVRGSVVVLLGVTYKPDVADERESPAQPVARRLLALGARVRYHDPFVDAWRVDGLPVVRADLDRDIAEADLVILLQPHRDYDLDALAKAAQLVLDTRGRLDGEGVERL
jgi:nucleotide sugar dehydrogenase